MSRRRTVVSPGEDDGRLTPYERRRVALGMRLRELRRAAGLDQTAMASRLGVTQSRISKIELGLHTPTAALLERIADALDLTADARTEILDQVAELDIEVRTLRVMHRRGGQRSIQADVGERERLATDHANYQGEVVQGLLQIADYTRAMVPLVFPDVPDLEALVVGRAERQRVLYDTSKRFRFLLHESALRARVAPVAVMRGQLDRLLFLASALPHLQIRVLPFSARLDAWVMTSFWIDDDEVGVELQAGTIAIRDPREVALYRDRFEALWRLGVAGDELVALVREIGRWLEGLSD